ncbi:hypothetical protein [Acidithiobacillus sulfurivorans]|uniref:Uncharacterized protein n=1 Tax=Acidithiobacillus sulfurivorans TaxID=1958756 RepID=A0ABS5ZXQ7_9PROT|nr:hypothetical protein [Acidithiobacillus sulfurivorans]MBU2760022.1 hypothetical protein [Acidithiobacillus sulfurivorans]
MQNMREKLADYCRAWREFLKDTFRGYERWPDGEARYKERWECLNAVLADFQRAPTNFDSRFGVGLAERIHEAEPTKTLEGTGRDFFMLRPEGYAEGEFADYDLAQKMEEAYRLMGWDEQYHHSEPDRIYSELNNFFNALSKELLRYEKDRALAFSRKENECREHYENKVIRCADTRDPRAKELFARKHCAFCFRLIPERSGATKSTIGKTCALHDPKRRPSLYPAALARQKVLQAHIAVQRENKKIEVMSNRDNPELAPLRILRLMDLALTAPQDIELLDDDLFNRTKALFLSDTKQQVDTNLLNALMDEVQSEFPPIARPDQFAKSVQSLIEKSRHTPPQLIKVFGWFFFDEFLPFYPSMVATYMRLFLEESWYAQNHAPEYYGLDRGKGRPPQVDPQEVIQAYKSLLTEAPGQERKAASILAREFGCTPRRVRQILKSHRLPKK